MAVTIKQNLQVRGVKALAERPDGTQVPFAPYPTPLRDPDGELTGAINMLADMTACRGDEVVRRGQGSTRLMAKEAECRANNLLMSILPIAGMVRADTAIRLKRSKGRAQAIALLLMEESSIGTGPARGFRAG